jgi:hypothetical protein
LDSLFFLMRFLFCLANREIWYSRSNKGSTKGHIIYEER